MDRRGFLQSLMIGASALALDLEKLLWIPGAKKIFIPPARIIAPDRSMSLSILVFSNIRRVPGYAFDQGDPHAETDIALPARQTQLRIGETPVTLKRISFMEPRVQMLDVTSETDPIDERPQYIKGLQEGRLLSCDCNFASDPESLNQLFAEFVKEHQFRVVMPDGLAYEFEGAVKGMAEVSNVSLAD